MRAGAVNAKEKVYFKKIQQIKIKEEFPDSLWKRTHSSRCTVSVLHSCRSGRGYKDWSGSRQKAGLRCGAQPC